MTQNVELLQYNVLSDQLLTLHKFVVACKQTFSLERLLQFVVAEGHNL